MLTCEVDDHYTVSFEANRETAREVIQWLQSNEQHLVKAHHVLEDVSDYSQILEKMEQYTGPNNFYFKVHFAQESVAMLALLKFSNASLK